MENTKVVYAKYRPNLYRILSDKHMKSLFMSFLVETYAQENLEFCEAIEEFINCKDSKLRNGKGKLIMEKFISKESASSLNIESKITKDLLKITVGGQFEENTFDEALDSVLRNLRNDCFPKFIKTEPYKCAIQDGKLYLHGLLRDSPDEFKNIIEADDKNNLFLWFEITHLRKLNLKEPWEKVKEKIEGNEMLIKV